MVYSQASTQDSSIIPIEHNQSLSQPLVQTLKLLCKQSNAEKAVHQFLQTIISCGSDFTRNFLQTILENSPFCGNVKDKTINNLLKEVLLQLNIDIIVEVIKEIPLNKINKENKSRIISLFHSFVEKDEHIREILTWFKNQQSRQTYNFLLRIIEHISQQNEQIQAKFVSALNQEGVELDYPELNNGNQKNMINWLTSLEKLPILSDDYKEELGKIVKESRLGLTFSDKIVTKFKRFKKEFWEEMLNKTTQRHKENEKIIAFASKVVADIIEGNRQMTAEEYLREIATALEFQRVKIVAKPIVVIPKKTNPKTPQNIKKNYENAEEKTAVQTIDINRNTLEKIVQDPSDYGIHYTTYTYRSFLPYDWFNNPETRIIKKTKRTYRKVLKEYSNFPSSYETQVEKQKVRDHIATTIIEILHEYKKFKFVDEKNRQLLSYCLYEILTNNAQFNMEERGTLLSQIFSTPTVEPEILKIVLKKTHNKKIQEQIRNIQALNKEYGF